MAVILLPFFIMIHSCAQKAETKEKGSEKKVVEVVEHYPDGKKKLEGKEIDGLREGKWIYYHENGLIWSEGKFKNGKRAGYSLVYHESGNKKVEGMYENGKKVGTWKFWKSDGSFADSIDFDKADTVLRTEAK